MDFARGGVSTRRACYQQGYPVKFLSTHSWDFFTVRTTECLNPEGFFTSQDLPFYVPGSAGSVFSKGWSFNLSVHGAVLARPTQGCRLLWSGNLGKTSVRKCVFLSDSVQKGGGHSGFAPSHRPIWTDFVGGNFQQRALFFGKSYIENENCSGSGNTPNNL